MGAPETVAAEPMDDREAMHRERARRYAEALATAAAAEEQIKALTEQLAEHEYARRVAEDEAGAASWINDDGPWASNVDTHVYHVGEPEPPDDREFLLSLSDGTLYRAVRLHKTEHNPKPGRRAWAQVQYGGTASIMIAEWSSVQEHAPFLAFTADTDWGLDRLVRMIEEHERDAAELRRRLPRKPDSSSWEPGTLPERLTVLEHQHLDRTAALRGETDAAVRKLRSAVFLGERMADALEADATPEQRATALGAWQAARDEVSS